MDTKNRKITIEEFGSNKNMIISNTEEVRDFFKRFNILPASRDTLTYGYLEYSSGKLWGVAPSSYIDLIKLNELESADEYEFWSKVKEAFYG